MRIKRRYLLVEGGSKEDVEQDILEGLGVLGWAEAKPVFVEGNKSLILSIERASLEKIRSAFEISPRKIKIKKVSGTIKGLL